MLGGVKLLIVNWRLSLLELVPASCIWLTTWDLKQHFLYGTPFQQLHGLVLALLWVVVVLFTMLFLACNTVFAFAIDTPPPRIMPAAREARAVTAGIVGWGVALGAVLACAVIIVPRVAGLWLYGILEWGAGDHDDGLRGRSPPGCHRDATSAPSVAEATDRRICRWRSPERGRGRPRLHRQSPGLGLPGVTRLAHRGFRAADNSTALFAGGLLAARAVKLGSKLVESPTGTLKDTRDGGERFGLSWTSRFGSPARDEAVPAPDWQL